MLVGSAAMTLVLVLALGSSGVNDLVQRVEEATPRLAEATRWVRVFVAERAGERGDELAPHGQPVAESGAPPPPVPPTSPSVEAPVEPPPEPAAAKPVPVPEERSAGTDPEPAPAFEAEPVPQSVESWHALWRPFYSERSARGFADRLARTTGLDYRVGKTAPGRYQVSVAYRDETERQARLEEISRVTGLSLEVLQP
jgi:hypothetical protein